MSTHEDNEFLTTREAAAFLDVSVQTLWLWRRDKTGPKYVRLGASQVKYRRQDLEDYIAQRTVAPEAAPNG